MAEPNQPLLAGLRVLELGHYIAAPFATRVMADLGADVIKIEPPAGGDPFRTWGTQVDGRSLWWSVQGRNKRSVTVDLRHAGGPALVRELVAHCDVVVENHKPGQLEKWGLGPADLEAVKPGLVMVRISGYGQTGPEAKRAGFGVIGEAKGGLRYLCGNPAAPDLAPVRTGISIGDSISGLYGALGALAAVMEARASGRRAIRVIDVALGESVLSLLEAVLPEYGYLGRVREPTGSTLPTTKPSSAYKSQDGFWVLIAANSDPLFRALARVMGQPGLAEDRRFIDNPARLAHGDALDALIEAWTRQRPAAEAIAALEAANIPVSKVYTVADIAADPQYQARDMIAAVADPVFGTEILQPGVVPVVAGQDRNAMIRWPGPALGQHTAEVLGGLLGKSAAEIAVLRRERVI
jgi:crotonobetainyl-CoA:carnitine CoA-transferase CaiB-like acyl-CoA transferase